jgi:MraZ protein
VGESGGKWSHPEILALVLLMSFFTGEFEHKVDPKGRLFVPRRILDGVSREEEGGKFIVTLGLDGCLYLFTRTGFEAHLRGMRKAAFGKKEYRAVMRGIGALSSEQALDSQGRLLLPEDLRKRIGLKDQAVVVGAIDHVEIWEANQYREHAAPEAEATYLEQAESFLQGDGEGDGGQP